MGILKDYFLNSTIHGFHFIADQRYHWSERLFWSICVLGSWFGSISLMRTALQQYRHQQISFSVDTSYLDWRTNFPAIFVCERKNADSTNKLKTKYGNLMNSTCLKFAENYAFYEGTLDYKVLPAGCGFGKYSQFVKESRNSCFDIIKFCMYNDEEFNCCEEFSNVSSYYGPCFGINTITTNKYHSRESLPFKITRNIKYGYGNLTFELKHQGFNILAAPHNSMISRRSVRLYEDANKDVNKELPRPYLYTYYVSVKEIFTTLESKILDVEHRGCRFHDENILKRSKFYSMAACDNECYSNFQNMSCGCITHTFPGIALEEECDASGLICFGNPEYEKKVKNYAEKCKCVSSCDDTEINLIGSNDKVEIEENVLRDKTSQLVVNVIVQPPTIRYTRQVVKTPLSVLVSVGGTVGLFIGASLLTIVEIVYYFLIRPIGNYCLNNNNKKNAGNNKDRLNNEQHNIRKRGKESRNISTVSKAKNVKSVQHYPRYYLK